MLSKTSRDTLIQSLANTSDSNILVTLDTLMNEFDRKTLSKKDWWFLERSFTSISTASQSSLAIQSPVRKILTVKVTSGTYTYPVDLINSQQEWDLITQSTSLTSTYPLYAFFSNNSLEFYPKIASASETITVSFIKRQKDLTIADYTTGTITTATNGDGTIVGSGTTWTAKMAGRFIRITDSDTANTGDGEWYEISSVTDGTNLELYGAYQGVSIAAGSASYELAQCSELPEEYQMIPVWHALSVHFTSFVRDFSVADRYKAEKQEDLNDMIEDQNKRTTSIRVNTKKRRTYNPNYHPHY